MKPEQVLREGWNAICHEDGKWKAVLVVGGQQTWYIWSTHNQGESEERYKARCEETVRRLNMIYGYLAK